MPRVSALLSIVDMLHVMVDYLPAVFALIVAAAGWFYVFYSRSAEKLEGVESQRTNRLRVRLRRLGGAAMILLAAAFYAGYVAIERENIVNAAGFVFAVALLLGVIVVLGLIDIRLTSKLRRERDEEKNL